jgi:hypothetical protein
MLRRVVSGSITCLNIWLNAAPDDDMQRSLAIVLLGRSMAKALQKVFDRKKSPAFRGAIHSWYPVGQ